LRLESPSLKKGEREIPHSSEVGKFTYRAVRTSGVCTDLCGESMRRIKTAQVILALLLVLLLILGFLAPLIKGGLGQELYTVHVEVVDSNNKPMDRVEVTISDYGSFTVLGGSTSINLKVGSFNASVHYMGVHVCSKPFTVNGPTRLILKCQVFSLKVTVKLPQNYSDPYVEVRVGGESNSTTTDGEGVASFPHLPTCRILIFAYAVRNETVRLVGAKDFTLLKNDEVTLQYSEFYSLRVEVRDSLGVPLKQPATVSVAGLSVETDPSGSAVLFTPPGKQMLTVKLHNVTVYESSLDVENDLSLRVKSTQIVPLDLTLLDESMAPLNDTTVQLRIGSANLTATTDSLGRIEIPQVPLDKKGLAFEVSVVGAGIPKRFEFKGESVTVEGIIAHGLTVKWRVLGAYMLGSASVAVKPLVGGRPVNGAVVTLLMHGWPVDVKKVARSSDFVVVKANIWFESTLDLAVMVEAYGMNRTERIPRFNTSPLIPLALPLSPLPLLLFVYLSREHRRRRLQLVSEA